MRPTLALVILAATAIVPVACSSKKPNPPMTPSTPASDAGTDGGAAEAMAAGDAGAGGFDAGAPDAAPPNVGALVSDANDAAIDLAIQALAAKVAPGMSPEGQPGRETLATNGHFNMIVTLQPNRCYTIIGYSLPGGVTQLDLQLLAPPLFNVTSNRAASPKNEAVIGRGKEALCPVSLVPIPYKIDAIASKGAGRIGVVVYSRSK